MGDGVKRMVCGELAEVSIIDSTRRPADMGVVMASMRREIYGPTLDEVYAEHVRSRVAA